MNLAQQLARVSRLDPDRPALFNGTQPVATYGEWAQRAAGLAASFAAAGLNPGDRVVLFGHLRPDTVTGADGKKYDAVTVHADRVEFASSKREVPA